MFTLKGQYIDKRYLFQEKLQVLQKKLQVSTVIKFFRYVGVMKMQAHCKSVT